MDHLEDHGMDTISYIMDPTEKTKMVSIVTNHGKYTLGEGTIQGDEDAAVYFDNHDKNNVRDAKRFVYNSCNEELRQQLNENCARDCSFVTYWLELIHATQSVSMERFASVTERIKNRKVSQYPGENIERMCSDYLRDWKELDTAAMFDNNLIMNMINNMMEAGGPNNEEFRFPLRILKMDIEKTLLANRHLDYHSAKEALVKVKSDVKSVLKRVKDQYRGQLDNGRWPAAMDAKDSKGMRRNYGAVNTLIQAPGNATKQKGNCNNCGARGHWKKECPLLKGKNKSATGRNGSKPKNRNNRLGRRLDPELTSPPKNGESEIKSRTKRGTGAANVPGGPCRILRMDTRASRN